ncbi:hypothetical protein BV898_10576 [Hypsibius exemplaris]|uniref:Tc1-like transposase DDE domain-containing protein n=1 Tax=Hypsibius exemplaris TaxID=2072580 RepID=A0A1W0WJ55_HYPEX|nr:hypothetical protein BV898_10576 [Hypsibius exemplaris]
MTASSATVGRVIKEFKLEQQGIVKSAKRLGNQNLPSIQQQPGLPYGTVWRIINWGLAGEKRSKRKTHMLSDKQVAQQVLRIPRLLKHLDGGKWRYIVSIDEAWCYMSHVNGRRKIYCRFREKESPQSWIKYCKQKHPRGVIFVAGISARGTTAIRFVPPRTKVNSDFYVKRVLKPIFKKDIPRLDGKDARSVVLYHDSAPSHTALDTVRFLQKSKYRYSKRGLAQQSPDLSPMDYSINSIFKRKLWKHKTKNLAGLIRAMKREWSNISVICAFGLSDLGKSVLFVQENYGL